MVVMLLTGKDKVMVLYHLFGDSLERLPVYVSVVLYITTLRLERKITLKMEFVATSFATQSQETKFKVTGPSGKIMLLPTDMAPYRGYLRRMFMESVPTYKFGGLAWLFLGVANSDSLLYDEEFSKYQRDYPDNFRFDRALRREQKNKTGGKMYVQDKMEEYSDGVFKLLDEGAHIYFCGLKGMTPGIQDTLKRVAEQRGENWETKPSQLKKNKQWHVEQPRILLQSAAPINTTAAET
ncbi:hypothetical protein C5167_042192 [Papaver somniferum]|uniref:ferredoxin--NADP(+) reductase n=1 Tax=Papaver somniferum TaxID=3469 RepID=A0A4Y7L252_PAPSO|nr:hypothetical protein C5167_042192 [Papaver somniferum]